MAGTGDNLTFLGLQASLHWGNSMGMLQIREGLSLQASMLGPNNGSPHDPGTAMPGGGGGDITGGGALSGLPSNPAQDSLKIRIQDMEQVY